MHVPCLNYNILPSVLKVNRSISYRETCLSQCEHNECLVKRLISYRNLLFMNLERYPTSTDTARAKYCTNKLTYCDAVT